MLTLSADLVDVGDCVSEATFFVGLATGTFPEQPTPGAAISYAQTSIAKYCNASVSIVLFLGCVLANSSTSP